jgi:hypothetical protein
MVVATLVAVRLVLGTAIAAYGVSKLVRFPRSASVMWRPSWVPDRVMSGAVLGLCLVECADLWVIGFGGLGWVATGLVVAPQAVVVTTYGRVALAKGHSCGCGGTPAKSTAVDQTRRLFLRNAVLFGGGAACAVAEPAVWRADHLDVAMLEVAALPILALLVLLSWRLLPLLRGRSFNAIAGQDQLHVRIARHS